MELKEIDIKNIKPNLSQPRELFHKEKVKELAESILSNGLINPISVREEKGKYIIVAGERRFQAHKMAGINKVQAFVRSYKKESDWMIESFVENVHREDITPTEKGKYLLKIKKLDKIEDNRKLSRKVNVDHKSVMAWIDDFQFRMSGNASPGASHTLIRSTRGLENKERNKLINWAEDNEISARKMDEVIVPAYKQADEGSKAALLSQYERNEEDKEPIVYERNEEDKEPIVYERTANDIVDDILSSLHSFKHNVDELLDDINIKDISKSKADKAITTTTLHFKKPLKNFLNILIKRGASPDKTILALMKANGNV